jgi:hypothetical protein
MTGHLFPAVTALPFGAHPGTLPIRPLERQTGY